MKIILELEPIHVATLQRSLEQTVMCAQNALAQITDQATRQLVEAGAEPPEPPARDAVPGDL